MSTTPICRCRVLYLGSSVPHITKDGLQGIQEPLRDLYPEQGSFSAKGIDSWLSVWSNGLLLENVDESMRQVTRFFNIETLHYCAAVRYVVVPGNNGERVEKFLPLDSPFARHADPNHAPLFACILRRTAGIKVLECHAFICKKEAAANALVRCCFHSYADSMQAKHLEENTYYLENKRSRSMSGLNTLEKVEVWRSHAEVPPMTNGTTMAGSLSPSSKLPTENGKITYASPAGLNGQDDDNYKVWTGIAPTERELLYVDSSGTMRSLKSGNATTRSAQVKVRQMVGPPRPPPPPSPSLINGKDHKLKPKSKSKNKKKQKDSQMIPPYPPHLMNGFRPTSAMEPFGVVVPPPQGLYSGSGLYTERRVRRVARPPIPGHEEPIYIPSTRPLSPVSSYQPAGFPYEQYFMQYGTAPRSRFSKGEPGKKRNLQHEYQPVCPPQLYQNQPCPPPERKYNGHENSNNNHHHHNEEKDDPDSPFNTGIYRKKGNHQNSNNHHHNEEKDDPDSPFNTGVYRKKGNPQSSNNHHHNEEKDDPDSPFNTGVYRKKGRPQLYQNQPCPPPERKHNGHENSNNDSNHHQDEEKEDPDSPFNTGIYRKKGHLNERAFSYSIRQEHRSRSNSLANLQFFSSGDQGSPGLGVQKSRDEDRKERELAQLVSALDLKENGGVGHLLTRDDPYIAIRPESNFMRRKAPAY